MKRNNFEKFIISQSAILIRNDKCLILRFAKNPTYWGLPGGRIDKGELNEEAFKRELKEELSMIKFKFISVVDYCMELSKRGEPTCSLANLIINDDDKIILSDEHLEMKWVSRDDLGNCNFFWTETQRMIEKGFKCYENYLEKQNN